MSAVLDILMPRMCPGCDSTLLSAEKRICIRCQIAIPRMEMTQDLSNPILSGLSGRVRVKGAYGFSSYRKGEVMQRLLHRIKYSGDRRLAFYLGENFGRELDRQLMGSDIDILAVVPLHWKRKRSRGYNQSEIISRGIASVLDKPVDHRILKRFRYQSSQTTKGRYERWINLQSSIRVEKPEVIRGRHVLLVDDVFTTGATIEACVEKLTEVKDVEVSVAVLASA